MAINNSFTPRTRFFCIALTISVTLFFLIILFISNIGNADISESDKTQTFSWNINKSGQTFGAASDAEESLRIAGVLSESEEREFYPDLILAQGDDGKTEGYVYYDDLYGHPPNDPDERAEWSKTRNGISIPLYEKDGKTVIGSFTLGSKGTSNAFVFFDDLFGDFPNTSETCQMWLESRHGMPVLIWNEDGTSVIGMFTIK